MAKIATKPKGIDVNAKFSLTRQELNAALIEREDEIDVVLTSLLCGEHPLLVGPPGTAKSYLLGTMMRWMGGEDESYFEILLSKFTVPEEVFGPLSLQGLKNDEFRRITKGMLPEARFAFLDEIFKASSAILNTTLRVLNERKYAFEPGVFGDCPLIMCVAASNEWPNDQDGGKELGALFDRFLLRKTVRPISTPAGRSRLLWKETTPKLSTYLGLSELEQAQAEVQNMSWDEGAGEALEEIIETLAMEGIRPGDRRQKKSVKVAQAYAWLCGGDFVDKHHLEILSHVLWDDPVEQPEKCAKVVMKIANPTGAIITEKLMQAADIVAKNTPTEAVAKLQEVQAALKELPPHAKKEQAIRHVGTLIRTKMNQVIGYREKE